MSRFAPLRGAVKTFVWIIRGTPLMLQVIVLFMGPRLLGLPNPWPAGSGGRLTAAVAAFVINYACYFSEIYRGGIEAVPRGQTEAGQVLGMTRRQNLFQGHAACRSSSASCRRWATRSSRSSRTLRSPT